VSTLLFFTMRSNLEAVGASAGFALGMVLIALIGSTLHGPVAVRFEDGELHVARRCLIGRRRCKAAEIASVRRARLGGLVLRDAHGHRLVLPARMGEISGFGDAFSTWIVGSLALMPAVPVAELPPVTLALVA
jgi:hypothetical protein